MAYIKSFSVTNLAGRKGTIERSLDRYVNVFWGLNGTGKTTLLRILDSALSNNAGELEDLPFDAATVVFHSDDHDIDVVRTFVRVGVSSVENYGDELLVDEEVDLDQEWMLLSDEDDEGSSRWVSTVLGHPDIASRVAVTPYSHTYLPISRIVEDRSDYYFRHSGLGREGTTPEQRFAAQVRRAWTAYSSKSLARIRDVQQQGLASVLAILFGGAYGGYATAIDVETRAEEAYDIVNAFLKGQNLNLKLGKDNFIAQYDESAVNRLVVAEIQAVRGRVEEHVKPQRELQSVIDEMYLGNKHLELTSRSNDGLSIRIGKKTIPLTSLSSGEKQLLQVLLEVLAIGESTVMIDEPELSLHVDWQQRLIPSMRRINPDAQLLLATHSPEVMVEIDDRHVFEL